MFGSFFPRDVLAELDRLQRDVQTSFDLSPSIRGLGRGGYPAVNVGGTAESVEVYAFAPGLDPASIELNLDRGVLSLSGERKSELPATDAKTAVHIHERYDGRFRRVITLPEDADPEGVTAQYRDGLLQISIKRRQAAQPRRIEIH